MAEAGSAKKPYRSIWAPCVGLCVLLGLLLSIHGFAPRSAITTRVLLPLSPALWYVLLACVIVALVYACFASYREHRRRLKIERAFGTTTHSELVAMLGASTLLGVWRDFLGKHRRAIRREIQRLPVCVVMGVEGAGRDDLIRAYAGVEQRAAETLTASVSSPFLSVHLGAQTVVQELSERVLVDERAVAGRALRKLWRNAFRPWLTPSAVQPPLAIVALDVERLRAGSAEEARASGMAVRGKLAVLSEVCQRPIPLRLALTTLDDRAGFAAYASLVARSKLDVEVPLEALRDDDMLEQALATALGSYARALPLALQQQSTRELESTLAFVSQLPELAQPLSIYVRELLRDSRFGAQVVLRSLSLADTRVVPSAFLPNPLRPEPAPEPLAPRVSWLSHRYLASAVALVPSLYLSLNYAIDRHHFRDALAKLERYPISFCAPDWPFMELPARLAVASFVSSFDGPDGPLRAVPFFYRARNKLAQRLSTSFHDGLLTGAAVDVFAQPGAAQDLRSVYLLALTQAPANPHLSALLEKNLDEVVVHVPFDYDTMLGYLGNPPTELGKVTLPPIPAQQPEQAPTQDEFASQLKSVVRAPVATRRAQIELLRSSAKRLRSAQAVEARRLEEDWLARELLSAMNDVPVARDLLPAVAHTKPPSDAQAELINTAVDLKPNFPGDVSHPLGDVLDAVWDEVCAQRVEPSELAACDTERRALLLPGELSEEERGYRAAVSQAVVDAWLERFARQFDSSSLDGEDLGALPALQEFTRVQRLLWGAESSGDLVLDYQQRLVPQLREAQALRKALDSQHQDQAAAKVTRAVGTAAALWGYAAAQWVLEDVESARDDFSTHAEKTLASAMVSAARSTSRLQAALRSAQAAANVARDAATLVKEPLFARLVDSLQDLDSGVAWFENDRPSQPLQEYLALLAEVSGLLATDEGRTAGERLRNAEANGERPELAALLSPAAALAFTSDRDKNSVAARYQVWKRKARPAETVAMLLDAPFDALSELGQARLGELGTALWDVRMRPALEQLSTLFPFAPHAAREVTPEELTRVLAPKNGSLTLDYAMYVQPLEAATPALVPAKLTRAWSSVQRLQSLLWTADGVAKPFAVALTPEPFDDDSGIMRVWLRSGAVPATPYVNQDPVPYTLTDDWSAQHDAELGARTRAAQGALFESAPRSYWSLLRLLHQMSLERASDASCMLRWTLPASSSHVRVRVLHEPFAALDLLASGTGPCAWAGGAR